MKSSQIHLPKALQYIASVPPPAVKTLKVSVLLQLQYDPRDLLLEVAPLLDRHGVRLLGKRLPHLGEVAVAVVGVPLE